MLSTSYCQHGTTASGEQTHPGIVATRSRTIPFGSTITVLSHPLPFGRRVWTVEDRMAEGDAAALDWYTPTCEAALDWGARTVRVHITPPRR